MATIAISLRSNSVSVRTYSCVKYCRRAGSSKTLRFLLVTASSSGGKRKKPSLDVEVARSKLSQKLLNDTASADVLKGSLNEKAFDDDVKRKQVLLIQSESVLKGLNFPSRRILGVIVLNILTVIYASNIPVIKETETVLDPSLFSVVRFTVATIPFIPFVLQTWRDSRIRIAGIELGLWVSAAYVMQGIGLVTSDVGRASFISALTIIVVPLLDGILGARIPKVTWFGATVALLGIALLESSGSPITIGDFWIFLSAIFFGIHMLRTEHFSRNTNRDKCLGLLGYEIIVIALASAIWYMWSNDTLNFHKMTPENLNWSDRWQEMVSLPWLPIVYTGCFSTGFCLWAELAAMRYVSATDTAIIYGLEPLWGAAFAWFFLGERWGPIGWLGAILILGGSFTVQLFGMSSEPSISSLTSSSELKDGCPQVDCLNKLDETKHKQNSDVKQRSSSKS